MEWNDLRQEKNVVIKNKSKRITYMLLNLLWVHISFCYKEFDEIRIEVSKILLKNSMWIQT